MAPRKNSLQDNNVLIRPLVAISRIVVSPQIMQPVKIEDDQVDRVTKLMTEKTEVLFLTDTVEEGQEDHNLVDTGVLCVVERMIQMPGAPNLAFVRPLARAKFLGLVIGQDGPYARLTTLKDITDPKIVTLEIKALEERISELFETIMRFAGEPEKVGAKKIVEDNSLFLTSRVYAMTNVAPLEWEDKIEILKCGTLKKLLETVAVIFDETEQRIKLQVYIHEKTHHELSQQQKETYLRAHLQNVREELGETDLNDLDELQAKAADKNWSKEARKHFEKELQKLRRLNVNNPEYSVQYAYLETLLELPWNNYKKSKISLDKVEEVLNRDHYGLDKVKERIMEYMAVVKLRNDLKAPILCLYGPPGVGKTSIGKSVAEAVGREYARISLGGMHDEAEIRGHRRTYIGAMPGRFLHTLSKLSSGNPLILLDEIDKVGKDYKGDPSSALLEALDPEQNNTFHDNFIDFPYDLSKVLFIATANDLSSIPPPLRDRMEVIEMPPYSKEEKREIAVRHLINQALTENGFKENEVAFTPDAIDTIIRQYTQEAGVRQLKMQISKIIRKLALLKVRKQKLPDEITGKLVSQFLDKKDSWRNSLGFRG
ncbi:MAG: AAA family ATPase [Muribaculaceae bacterium]|nr:AAA family ATPase [Muribaculaceae bacterium]